MNLNNQKALRAILEKASKADLVWHVAEILDRHDMDPQALEDSFQQWRLEEAERRAFAAMEAARRNSAEAYAALGSTTAAGDSATNEDRFRVFEAYVAAASEHIEAQEAHEKAFKAALEGRFQKK